MSHVIQLVEHGGPEVLQWVEREVQQPGPGELLVRHEAVGVNFIDIYYRRGLYSAPLPHGLGVEAAGVVEAVGSGVFECKVGDRVAYATAPLGAYAERRLVPAACAVPIPSLLSSVDAAAGLMKGLTVQYLFRQVFPLQAGQTILFHAAAGGVGLIACQWARALGVRLIGTVSSDEKAALAKAHGAWETIVYTREDTAHRVLELTEGRKVPVVFDAVGRDTWESSLDSLSPRGLMVSFGNASGPVTGVNVGVLASKGSLFLTRPTLFHYVDTRPKLEAGCSDVFEMMLSSDLVVKPQHQWPLAAAREAHEALEARQILGPAVLLP